MFARPMTRATLTICIPADVWIGRVSRSQPEAELTILSAFPADDSGVGLVQITGPDVPAVIRALDDEANVTELQVLTHADETALVQIETTEPTLLFPIVGSGIPLEMPFSIQEGQARWTVTTSHDRLSKLGEQLETFDIAYTLHTLEHDHSPEAVLTDDQRALIDAAIEAGYYDVPRTCTLTDLADRVGIAKSTCSEKLHRAESKIVRSFALEDADSESDSESDGGSSSGFDSGSSRLEVPTR